MKPVIALVGRPNVGKSTLFNRLTRSRDAIVHDLPGVTRDRHYGEGRQGSRAFIAIDTGGLEPTAQEGIYAEMARQAEQAMAEADAVVFLVDARAGLTPGDRQIAWPKLRALLGVKRLSMPNAETAREVTGYERGTITPFGSLNPWPVVADARVDETVSIGGGAHGVSATVAAADLIRVLNADIADVTDPL